MGQFGIVPAHEREHFAIHFSSPKIDRFPPLFDGGLCWLSEHLFSLLELAKTVEGLVSHG